MQIVSWEGECGYRGLFPEIAAAIGKIERVGTKAAVAATVCEAGNSFKGQAEAGEMQPALRTQKRKERGTGAKLTLAVLIGLPTLAVMIWFPEAVVKAAVLTGGLFWALTTSFTSRWRDSKFWIVVALLFAVYLVAMSAFIGRMAALNTYSLVIIGFAEIAVMVVVLLVAGQRADS